MASRTVCRVQTYQTGKRNHLTPECPITCKSAEPHAALLRGSHEQSR